MRILGWLIIVLSVVFSLWLIIAFAVAIPPPEYLLPRLFLVSSDYDCLTAPIIPILEQEVSEFSLTAHDIEN
jgi:hypothetical protein